MKIKMFKHTILFLLFFFPFQSLATLITQSYENVSGNTWEWEFSVYNDSIPDGIESFTLWFDYLEFENIQVITTPESWDIILIQPEPAFPDDGFLDGLALGNSINIGDTLNGLSLQFEWTGIGLPPPLFFEIYDPVSWELLDSGFTQITVNEVPEPSSFILLISGVLIILSKSISRKEHYYESI